MYIPPSFRQADLEKLHALMERYSFATLVSQAGGEPLASHLPLLLDRDRGPEGTLLGHMARANSHWQSAADQKVLAIYHGPDVYISPAWYAEPNVVPTWNYVAVHAYGTLRLIEDRDRLHALIERTVERYEAAETEPWSLDSQDPAFISGLLNAIVGFEIEVDRLEGKWKLNQNQSAARQGRVIQALRQAGTGNALEVADLMETG